MPLPKISVIVPNYNHASYLRQRLDSILTQTYNDLELLIIDDASTDDSWRILTRYHSKPGVQIVVNTSNSGTAFHQWNRGLAMARGEYVWIAESDDAADPHFLETVVPMLDENPSLGLVYCQSRLINKQGADVGDSLNWTSDLDAARWSRDFAGNGRDEIRNYLIHKNTIPNASAVVTRRSILAKVFPVDTTFKLCGDWMHWGKVLLETDLAYVADPLNYWRLGSSNSRPLPPGVLEWTEGQRVVEYLAHALALDEAGKAEALSAFEMRCKEWTAAATGAQ